MRLTEGASTTEPGTEPGPAASQLLAAWTAMRGSQPAPRRQDLDLRQLKSLMPNLFIAERTAPGQPFTWRLAGTAICQLHRRELTGTGLLSGWPAFESGVVERFLRGVTHAHRTALFRLRFRTDRSNPINAEMIALPLIPRSGRMQVLGGLFTAEGAHARNHAAIVEVELRTASFLNHAEAPATAIDPLQARRKFHVIAGGLDLSRGDSHP
jgi:hypothetical protein